MNRSPIRVLIGDDHPLVTEGLRTLLAMDKKIAVISTAGTGKEILEKIVIFQPDVLLLDVNLPDMDGLEVCLQVKKNNSEVFILGLSTYSERSIILRLLQNGASGFLLKNSPIAEIKKAVETVATGAVYLSGQAQQLLTAGELFATREKPVLTAREDQVLKLVMQGLSSPQIATQLFISTLTVESHRKSLMQKFQVHNVAVLVRKATEWGYDK
jgi:DNA-binding NarL/FixJ family response regulator